MTHYAYPLSLIVGGILRGLELGFIAVAGKPARLAFDLKEGAFAMVAGVLLVLVALAFFRP